MNNPDFSTLSYDSFKFSGAKAAPVAAADWMTYEQIPVKPVFTAADLPASSELDKVPRPRALHARPLFDDVRRQALDRASIRRFLDRRRVQRFLQA